MAPQGDAVYATLVMTDSYLPGAMVLAHSLRDRGARKARLAALVLLERLSLDSVAELRTVYDDIVPVDQIINMQPANLYLMNRPDLISTFTKIELWKQTQYKRIVYLDADMVAVRAPNELLTLDTHFAAAPDVGWPDCFNSGMMVLNPNMADYYSLLALAKRGISFDGADQGLLNMHFTDWERLSFVYNCTPNANYQYVPAYRYFQNSISMVHFIGAQKPWTQGRDYKSNSGVYGELLARWWAVYDSHYKQPKPIEQQQFNIPRSKVQDYVHGEQASYTQPPSAPPAQSSQPSSQSHHQEQSRSHSSFESHVGSSADHASSTERPFGDQPGLDERIQQNNYQPTPTQEQRRWSAPHAEWEPTRQPPPVNSKPEAANFPTQQYEFNESKTLFEPPASYPEPPKDMWYQVPEKPKPEESKPKMLFPWEERAPKPTRVFPKSRESTPPPSENRAQEDTGSAMSGLDAALAATHRSSTEQFGMTSPLGSIPGPRTSISQPSEPSQPASPPRPPSPPRHVFPWEARAPKPTRVFPQDDVLSPPAAATEILTEEAQGNSTNEELRRTRSPENPWEAFSQRTNQWDENPEITRYMEKLNKPRKAPIQVLLNQQSQLDDGKEGPPPVTERRISLRLTDFPTAVERPSLPVTPAPIRRSGYFGEETEEQSVMPIAQGVPRQEEWVRRFTSQYLPAVPNPILRDIGGTLHLTCQHCGKQNPIIKLEELQRRQNQMLAGEELITSAPTLPEREMPESQSAEEAIEAAVKSMTISSRPKAPKPILREPHFEMLQDDDTEVATNELIVANAHTTATGSRSPIRFNPIVLEGEAVSERSDVNDLSNSEVPLSPEGPSSAAHHHFSSHEEEVEEPLAEKSPAQVNRSSFGEDDLTYENREAMVSELRSAFKGDPNSKRLEPSSTSQSLANFETPNFQNTEPFTASRYIPSSGLPTSNQSTSTTAYNNTTAATTTTTTTTTSITPSSTQPITARSYYSLVTQFDDMS